MATYSFSLLFKCVDACVLTFAQKHKCGHACDGPLSARRRFLNERLAILSEPWEPGFSVTESAACSRLHPFVWMCSNARTAVASGPIIMQPAELRLSTLITDGVGWKRVREWERPVIWRLSNVERVSRRQSERVHATTRNEVKWDKQIVPLTAASVPHTTTAAGEFVFPASMTADLGRFVIIWFLHSDGRASSRLQLRKSLKGVLFAR